MAFRWDRRIRRKVLLHRRKVAVRRALGLVGLVVHRRRGQWSRNHRTGHDRPGLLDDRMSSWWQVESTIAPRDDIIMRTPLKVVQTKCFFL